MTSVSPAYAGNRSTRGVSLILIGLSLGPGIGLGLGRFGYSLLLPPMRTDLGWSYAIAGGMSSANALGYLIGAFVAAPVARRFGSIRSFWVGTCTTAGAMALSATTGEVWLQLFLRTLSGVSGAVLFIVGATLVSGLAADRPARRALFLGIYFGGVGLGMASSAYAVPAILATLSPSAGWRVAWLALGGIGVLATIVVLVVLKWTPQVPIAGAGGPSRWPMRGLTPLLIGYFLFGAGYIAYMTFIVALLRDRGFGPGEVTAFWAVLGIAGTVSCLAWSPVLSRMRGGAGLAFVMLVVLLGAALPAVSESSAATFVSAALFASFLSVPTAVTSFARSQMAPELLTSALGILTAAFAIGQFFGPALSGVVADTPGGIALALLTSLGALGAGAAAFLSQTDRSSSAPPEA